MEDTIAVELADGRRILISPSKKKFAEYHPHYLTEGTKIINSVVVGTQYRGVVHNFTRADESELRSQTVTGTLAGHGSAVKRPSTAMEILQEETPLAPSEWKAKKNATIAARELIRNLDHGYHFNKEKNLIVDLFRLLLRRLFPGEEF